MFPPHQRFQKLWLAETVAGVAMALQHRRGADGVAAQAVGEGSAPGVVVDLTCAVTKGGVGGVACGATGSTAVLAIGSGTEVAQIGLQAALTQGQVVAQAGKVLLVEIFQIGVVVLCGQILVDLPVTTTEVELVGVSLAIPAAIDRQTGAVARGTANGVLDLTGSQGQMSISLEVIMPPSNICGSRRPSLEVKIGSFGIRVPMRASVLETRTLPVRPPLLKASTALP